MDTQNVFYCQRPINLDIDALLQTNPPPFSYKRDGFLYLMDIWIEQYNWRDSKKLLAKGNYVPLRSQKLKRVLYDYEDYKNYLLEVGIWQSDKKYIIGKKSTSYKLADEYLGKFTTEQITHKKLIDRILCVRQVDNEKINNTYPGLIEWFNGLEIDVEGATQCVEKIIRAKVKKKQKPKRGRAIALAEACYLRSILKIANKDYSFKIDDRSGRFFSVLTNMKKELRAYLTYNGEKLVCVDLSNSQPFFSLLLLNLDFYNSTDTDFININHLTQYVQKGLKTVMNNAKAIINEVDKWTYNERRHFGRKVDYQEISTSFLPTCGRRGDFQGNEKEDLHDSGLYCYNVRHGNLYESILAIMPEGSTRKQAKQSVITIFFADNDDRRPHFIKNRKLFEQLYPNVNRVFWQIKREDYTLLSITLQNVEAEVFLSRICKRLYQQHPTIPVFTIHDSICTTISHEAFLTEIVYEEITKAMGIRPHLKKEDWGSGSENNLVELPQPIICI